VNSATHIWGSRRFATRDDSTNNWLVALLTFGEGWHNNHHAHPTSARHGLRWYEVDMNWYGIWMLKVFGLAKQIKFAPLSASQSQPNPTSARHSQSAAGELEINGTKPMCDSAEVTEYFGRNVLVAKLRQHSTNKLLLWEGPW
jgi:hypothetical protein